MEEEIKAEFSNSGFSLDEEEVILRKCLTFCINYSLSPSDLVSSWEVYYLNRQLNESTVHDAEMDGFLLHLQNAVKESIINEEPDLHVYSSKDVDMMFNDGDRYAKEETIGTPTNKLYSHSSELFDSEYQQNGSTFSAGKLSDIVTPFGHRKEKFAVRFSINQPPTEENAKELEPDSEDDFLKKVESRGRCSMILHGVKLDPNCRYMYDRIEDRFNALEGRIKSYSRALILSGVHGELMDPSVASQKSMVSVGMICCDGEGHLNDNSILLQSSDEHSGGQRVRLDLQRLSQFSVFPGQVVGIEGNNPSGHCLIASKIIDSNPLSASADINLPSAKRQALDKEGQIDPSFSDKELSMIIAAGPFTTTDNLFFEPLTELLSYASRKIPQLLILLGPFVDSEHPEIRRGATERSFNEIFHMEILRKLRDYVEYLGDTVRVVLVPSIRDANHDFVFPQPGFDIRSSDLNDQITNLTNPGIFEANRSR